MKKCPSLIFAGFLALTSICFAQNHQESKNGQAAADQSQSTHKLFTPDTIKWVTTEPGQAYAVLSGTPGKEGSPFVLRLKFPDGAKIAPHWHPIDEQLTVISGTFFMGMGEKFDPSAAHEMPAGSYELMPKEMRHFAWTKGETVIQIHGIGPFKTIWVNPADDPSKKPNNE